MPGISLPKLEEELEQEEGRQEEYDIALCNWEQEYDKLTGYAKNMASKVKVPSWCNIIQEEGTECSMNAGVFWPKGVFDAIESTLLDKSACVKFVHCCKSYLGVWRDKKFGEPTGTITKWLLRKLRR